MLTTPFRSFLAMTILGFACGALGCSDGNVAAKGRVTVEGQPAVGGRLAFAPVGGGPRAYAGVGQNGEFSLRTTDAEGLPPGSYRVSLRMPMDERLHARLIRNLQGYTALDGLSISYESPKGETTEIAETGEEDLLVDIQSKKGWKYYVNE